MRHPSIPAEMACYHEEERRRAQFAAVWTLLPWALFVLGVAACVVYVAARGIPA